MEVITGVPPAEFGDKNSLVVRVVTKSGLGDGTPSGSVSGSYGSFASPTADLTLGAGSRRFGNFLVASGLRTDRFLDSPEFAPMHDAGTQASLFDRVDWQHDPNGALHLNVQLARSAFHVPNTYDQQGAGQDQRQSIDTVNVAPGYARSLNDQWLLTANTCTCGGITSPTRRARTRLRHRPRSRRIARSPTSAPRRTRPTCRGPTRSSSAPSSARPSSTSTSRSASRTRRSTRRASTRRARR